MRGRVMSKVVALLLALAVLLAAAAPAFAGGKDSDTKSGGSDSGWVTKKKPNISWE